MTASDDSSPTRAAEIASTDEKSGKLVDDQSQDVGIESQKDIENIPEIDHVAETALVRKLDRYIIPPTMLLYLVSFGIVPNQTNSFRGQGDDRINISKLTNARSRSLTE